VNGLLWKKWKKSIDRSKHISPHFSPDGRDDHARVVKCFLLMNQYIDYFQELDG